MCEGVVGSGGGDSSRYMIVHEAKKYKKYTLIINTKLDINVFKFN